MKKKPEQMQDQGGHMIKTKIAAVEMRIEGDKDQKMENMTTMKKEGRR